MDNSQSNSTSAPPDEEQVPRVEETATGGNLQEGNPSGASTASTQVQPQTAQNTTQGDATTPLETGARQRTDAEAAGGRGEGGLRGGAGRAEPGKAAEASQRHPRTQQIPELRHRSSDTRPGAAYYHRSRGHQQRAHGGVEESQREAGHPQ
jgi:hypothetical protein